MTVQRLFEMTADSYPAIQLGFCWVLLNSTIYIEYFFQCQTLGRNRTATARRAQTERGSS